MLIIAENKPCVVFKHKDHVCKIVKQSSSNQWSIEVSNSLAIVSECTIVKLPTGKYKLGELSIVFSTLIDVAMYYIVNNDKVSE